MFKKIKFLLILYCLIGIILYHFQDSLIFHPSEKGSEDNQKSKFNFDELKITVNQKDNISILRFRPDSSSKGLILFFYPNCRRAEYYADRTAFFTERGYEVWIPDYPGFGNSRGELTESSFYKWADQVFSLASSKYSTDSIVLYGYSFGTCMASYLGSYNFSVKAILLESPYYSMKSQLKKYAGIYPVAQMSSFDFPVWKFLDEDRSPVGIFRGKRDEIVSARDMNKLKSHLKKEDVFQEIDSATHLQIHHSYAWKTSIDQFLNK